MPTSSTDRSVSDTLAPLPNGLDPFADESLPGFVMRMADNHGYGKPLDLLKVLGPGLTTLRLAALRGSTHEGMADYLALSPGELDQLCYGSGPNYRIFGHELHDDLVVLGRRKFCPACIGEAPYHRAFWDLTLATVCPVHAVRLVDRCPHCERTLNWKAGPITSCSSSRCAGDLHWAEAVPVPGTEMGGVRGLHRLMHTGECSEFGAPVRALPVGEQIRLMFHLGCLARGREAISRPTDFARLHPGEVHLVLDAGWRMCSDWPSAFHAFLDSRRERARERKGRYGVHKHFGHLHRWLEGSLKCSAFPETHRVPRNAEHCGRDKVGEPFARLLADELRGYIVACPELATRAPELRRARSAADLEHRFITMAEAREVLGASSKTMHALATKHGLYLVPPSGHGAPALLRADLVHDLHQERSRLLTREDVRRMLGSGKRTVDKLREAGLLNTVPDAGDPDGILYPVEGVEALLQDLERRILAGGGRAAPARGPAGGGALPQPRYRRSLAGGHGPTRPVTMAGIARRVSKPGFDVCDVIGAVREGRLTPAGMAPRARGLHRILFRSSDVDRFVADITEVVGRTLSVVEAAVELGVKQEVAYHWVRTGLLATVTVDSPTETGRRVTEAALAAFRRNYVTGTEFARAHQLGRRWAAAHLVQAGIQAVSGPSVDGARQFLFRRADVQDLDPKRLVSGKSKLQPQVARTRRVDRSGSEGFKYAVGKALKREFGEDLARRYHRYQQAATGTVIQVMTASNVGTAGTYKFLLSIKQRAQLAAAERGFLALSFADREDFLLVPWAEIDPLIASLQSYDGPHGRVWCFLVRADVEGRLAPFGGHARRLRQRRAR